MTKAFPGILESMIVCNLQNLKWGLFVVYMNLIRDSVHSGSVSAYPERTFFNKKRKSGPKHLKNVMQITKA